MQSVALDEAVAVDACRVLDAGTERGNRCVDVGGRRDRWPSSSATGSGDTAARRPSRRSCPRSVLRGSARPPRRAAARPVGGARRRARGRSADRAPRRCRRRSPIRRGDDRDGGDSAATGRDRGRRRDEPRGASRTPCAEPRRPIRARRRRSRRNGPSRRRACSAAARASSTRVATSRARSSSASHVPFDPSVSTRRCTSLPAAAQRGERPPGAELDVIGVRTDRERPARRCPLARGVRACSGGAHGTVRRSSATRSAGTSTS